MQTGSLFKKYDLPVPRYTSYPTVPYWSITPSKDQWIQHLNTALSTEQSSWSMYLHIPYCETLCTFCGCNTIITKNHGLENFYVELLLKEWEIYKKSVPAFTAKPLKQLHLGGGTPTFLSAASLTHLLSTILNDVKKDKNFEASIEVDPRRTNKEQLKALKDVGFNRVSMGVQDFNHEVQRLINRVQPYDITKNLTDDARELGFGSVNYDLIYGLAKQTLESFGDTIDKTIELRPDRIALYSFALVPWIKPAQRLFKDEDLPATDDKRKLYELARTKLTAAGYVEIGMDHFALPDENLSLALKNKTLHRNFMGYTDHKTDVLLGLGISSISESPYSFHQNEKVSSIYETAVQAGQLPTHRGHVLNEEDIIRRQQILNLMTNYEVNFTDIEQKSSAEHYLSEMLKDDLIEITDTTLKVKTAGKPFLRNACVFFDEHLKRKQPESKLFSRSI